MMLGLPQSTEVRIPIPNIQLQNKKIRGRARELFDKQIHSITIRSIISSESVNVEDGQDIHKIYVLEIQLNTHPCNDSNLLILSKLGQKTIYLLQFGNIASLAVVEEGCIISTQPAPIADIILTLDGLNLDSIWHNIVCSIGEFHKFQPLGESIAEYKRISDLDKRILQLEKKFNKEKQNHIRRQIHAEIDRLKTERGSGYKDSSESPDEHKLTESGKCEYQGGFYEGELLNGKPHGRGILNEKDGSCYDGNWNNGEFTGWGVYRNASGLERNGFFINKIFKGKIWTIDESNRQNELENYDPGQEYNVLIVYGGTNYRGSWRNGMKNGYGKETHPNSSAPYEGFFYNDRYIGKMYRMDEFGKYKDEAGNPFLIRPRDGKVTGRVRIEYPNGDVYEGMWNEGFREGRGTYSYSNGNRYVGSWKHDQRWDDGAQYISKGEYVYMGLFRIDQFDGLGWIEYTKTGVIFKGYFKDGQRDGEGILRYNGCMCEGNWTRNKKDGLFNFKLNDESVLMATMVGDLFKKGRYTTNKGGSISISMDNGQVNAECYGPLSIQIETIERFINHVSDGSIWIFDRGFIKSLVDNNDMFSEPVGFLESNNILDFTQPSEEYQESNDPTFENERALRRSFDWRYPDYN